MVFEIILGSSIEKLGRSSCRNGRSENRYRLFSICRNEEPARCAELHQLRVISVQLDLARRAKRVGLFR